MFNQEQDFIVRQIKAIADAIAALIFGKAEVAYVIQDEVNHTETDILFLHLNEMLDAGNINEAENLLFDKLNINDKNYLLLAIDFYLKLGTKSDNELENSGFSREEVEDGFYEVVDMYGIKL